MSSMEIAVLWRAANGIGPAATLQTSNRDVLGRNLGHITLYLRGIPQFQQSNTGVLPQLGHDRLIPVYL
jgi:hypothetical protein